MARLLSIQVGRPRDLETDEGVEWRSAFIKAPVAGPVRLGKLNLDGDFQADQRHHGGPDQAVLCYSADHYPAWRSELEIPELPYGGFGENFTIEGHAEDSVYVGDVYEVGEAMVQVSVQRGPCYKISYRWNLPDLLALVERSGRHGWYLRVLREGLVEPGLEVRLVERPNPGWTIRRAADVWRRRRVDREAASLLAACPEYPADAREELLNDR